MQVCFDTNLCAEFRSYRLFRSHVEPVFLYRQAVGVRHRHLTPNAVVENPDVPVAIPNPLRFRFADAHPYRLPVRLDIQRIPGAEKIVVVDGDVQPSAGMSS